MKSWIAIFIALWFFHCQTTPKTLTAREVFQKNSPNVPIIHSFFDKTYSGNGSSFVVTYNKKNYLITNYHVITNGNIALEWKGKIIQPDIIHVNDFEDIAILTFPGIEKVQGINISAYEPGEGEVAYALGYPYVGGNATKSNLTITEGLVSNSKLLINRGENGNKRYIQLSVPVNHGNSGGPVFNDNGQLIGMTTLKWMNMASVSAAIPTADIIREIKTVNPNKIISEMEATKSLKQRLDLIAISVNEMDILEFGYHYSPSVKKIIYPIAKESLEKISKAHKESQEEAKGGDEDYEKLIQTKLNNFEFVYYLMILRYFKDNPGTTINHISSNPFLTSQLFLAARFLIIFMQMADLPYNEIDFTHYKINKITYDPDRIKADVEATIFLSKKSFPIQFSFIREWGIWFLIPSVGPDKI